MKLELIRRHFTATGGAELCTRRLLGELPDVGHEIHLFGKSRGVKADAVQLRSVPVSSARARDSEEMEFHGVWFFVPPFREEMKFMPLFRQGTKQPLQIQFRAASGGKLPTYQCQSHAHLG
jgi:hypothetical protein